MTKFKLASAFIGTALFYCLIGFVFQSYYPGDWHLFGRIAFAVVVLACSWYVISPPPEDMFPLGKLIVVELALAYQGKYGTQENIAKLIETIAKPEVKDTLEVWHIIRHFNATGLAITKKESQS